MRDKRVGRRHCWLSDFRHPLARFLWLALAIPLLLNQANASPTGRVKPASRQFPFVLVATSQSVGLQLRQSLDLQASGNLVSAEQLARQALADALTLPRRRNTSIAVAQSILGSILRDVGKFEEAETLLRQSLASDEAVFGVGHFSTISTLGSLGTLYLRQGRLVEASGAFEAAVKITERKYGRNSMEAAEMLNSLASSYASMGRPQEAEQAFRRVLDTAKKGGASSLDLAAGAANNLAIVLQQMGRNDEAIAAYKEAFGANAAFFGPDNPAPMLNLMNAGVLYRETGNFAAAEQLLSTVLSYRERVLGEDHPETAQAQNNMGWLELAKGLPKDALAYFRKSVGAYQRFHARQARGIRGQGTGIAEREVGRSILGLLRALAKTQSLEPDQSAALLDEGFQAAQGIHANVAADSLARAGARLASGDGELGDMLRQGQDIAAQWQSIDAALTKALASPARQRNPEVEQQAEEQLKAIGLNLDAIDGEIAKHFPAYASFAQPKPISVVDVQKLLDPDEALVLISAFGGSNGDGTFVWVITKQQAKATATDTSLETLGTLVWTLRCGLDVGATSTAAGSADCTARTGGNDASGLPRFNAKASYELFHALFGGLEPVIAGKSLIVVAPDPLASIPFQVFATKPPAEEYPQSQAAFRSVAWLGRDNPIFVLPSVTALRVLRGEGTREPASEPYVGIGDPVLTGSLDCPTTEAELDCPAPVSSRPPSVVKRSAVGIGKLFKNGNVDVEAVRSLCPLPDTATELRCVASSIGASPASVYIGEHATVAVIKQLDLEKYRIIHFATHGLVAGDLESPDGTLGEPALVLTPPAVATADDDGLLKESDIVALKLNADWVILSACNTAAGQQTGGEALSGLASAFLYAGARALLASHWPVSSDAAVRLTTAAMAELSKDASIGRAEAMRRSMVNILDHGGKFDAHPLIWAPFSVIGEGGKGHL
jgi:tetratricopeptide (TPR) repeat protein